MTNYYTYSRASTPTKITAPDLYAALLSIYHGDLKDAISEPRKRLQELRLTGSTRFVHLKKSTVCHLTISSQFSSPCQTNRPINLASHAKGDS